MKYVCVLFLLFAVVFAGHHEMCEVFEAASDKCLKDMNMEKDAVKDYVIGKGDKETAGENVKCYFKCIMEGLKWMNENGDIMPNNEAGLPEDFVKFGTECKDVTGANACDKAFNFHNCFVEKKHANR